MSDHDAVIVSLARTPIGSFQGTLQSQTAIQLGTTAVRAAVERASIESDTIDEVILGQVLMGGAGQAPARQAALGAGLSKSTTCTTVNKVCGSGLYAIMQARRAIALGEASVVVAGGMESMSQAPYLLPKARQGFRMGNQQVVDAMLHDGLWDPYRQEHMGTLGDLCADEHQISRQAQDDYARESYQRAIAAQASDCFAEEIVPVTMQTRGKQTEITEDEEPSRYREEKVASLRPAFSSEGSVTPANASKLSDGAAAVVVMSRAEARRQGCPVLATIVADATYSHEPSWFTTAPPLAIRKVAERANVDLNAIDLFEINEAFAVVALHAIDQLGIDAQRVNVHGGAISLGHPIGCSGARILVTLLSAMRRLDRQLGCASLCLGGGEAVAMLIQRET